MPSRMAATAADMPLSCQSLNNYAQIIPDKTARHKPIVALPPEIWGLAALLKSGRFYHTAANYPYGGNVKTWGWIVLIAGVIVLLAGFYVMTGALWARIVGITLASLSALANFFFIPFYPFWSLMIITLDIFVIWALAAHGKALVDR